MAVVKKTVSSIVSAVAILVIIIVGIFYFFGNHLIKAGIETGGTKALKVGVSVGSVDLSLLGGSVAIKELVVENPKGYENKNLLELGSGEVKTKISALLGNPAVIQQIKLDNVNVVLEQKGLSNNIQDVLNALPPAGEKSGEGGGKKLKVDELVLNNITVKAKLLPIPGKSDTVTLHLTPITMHNLGGDNKFDTGELSKIILGKITEAIAKEGAGILPKDMVGAMESSLGKNFNLSPETIKKAEELLKSGKTKDAVEGIKGLLGPKK